MKKILLLILALVLMVGLTACAANTTPAPKELVTPFPTVMPGTNTLGESPAPESAIVSSMTCAESTALSQKANDAAVKISEVDSCVTAIIGDTCVAGVAFDSQYKGELTDRIRDMVTSRIQSVAPTLERIAITSDPELAATIGDIANKITQTNTLTTLTDDLTAVIDKIQ